jgi:hypothetical protein
MARHPMSWSWVQARQAFFLVSCWTVWEFPMRSLSEARRFDLLVSFLYAVNLSCKKSEKKDLMFIINENLSAVMSLNANILATLEQVGLLEEIERISKPSKAFHVHKVNMDQIAVFKGGDDAKDL